MVLLLENIRPEERFMSFFVCAAKEGKSKRSECGKDVVWHKYN